MPPENVTFLFTDIEGSTRLWERHPRAMPIALIRHDTLLRHAFDTHGGRIFKTVGDAFYVRFDDIYRAIHAAFDLQRALVDETWGATGPIRVRVAIHSGEAEERDGDFFGSSLSRVARMLSLGHGGQVLVSSVVRAAAGNRLPDGAIFRDLGEWRLRDLEQTERVYQLFHPDLPGEFPALIGDPVDDLQVPAPAPIAAVQRAAQRTPAETYHDLPAPEQRLFRAFSIFAPKEGGTREAARAICPSGDTRAALNTLTDSGLLVRLTFAGSVDDRYRLPDDVRALARAELDDAAETDDARRRHGLFFLKFAERTAPKLTGPEREATLALLDADAENLRTALGWAFEAREMTTFLRLAGALASFWALRPQVLENRVWIDRARALTERADLAQAPAKAKRLLRAGFDRARTLGQQLGQQGLEAFGIAPESAPEPEKNDDTNPPR